MPEPIIIQPKSPPPLEHLRLWEYYQSMHAHLSVFDYGRCFCWCGEQHPFDGDLATAGSVVFWVSEERKALFMEWDLSMRAYKAHAENCDVCYRTSVYCDLGLVLINSQREAYEAYNIELGGALGPMHPLG